MSGPRRASARVWSSRTGPPQRTASSSAPRSTSQGLPRPSAPRRPHRPATAHAQVRAENDAALEAQDQVLPDRLDRLESPAVEGRRDVRGLRPRVDGFHLERLADERLEPGRGPVEGVALRHSSRSTGASAAARTTRPPTRRGSRSGPPRRRGALPARLGGDGDGTVGHDGAVAVRLALRDDDRHPRRSLEVLQAAARPGCEPEDVVERDERDWAGLRVAPSRGGGKHAVAALLEERDEVRCSECLLGRPGAEDPAARPAVARFLDVVQSQGRRTARRGPARNPASTRSGMTSLSVTGSPSKRSTASRFAPPPRT